MHKSNINIYRHKIVIDNSIDNIYSSYYMYTIVNIRICEYVLKVN